MNIGNQVGGLHGGGRIELIPEIKRMIAHQVKLGALKEGDKVWLKFVFELKIYLN